ncbi:20629_t:CDS:2, partial [Racocetra persica]
FDDLVKKYINNLAPNKKEKALINKKKLQQIKEVLLDPTNTKLYTSAFYDLILDTLSTIEPSNQDSNLDKSTNTDDTIPILESSYPSLKNDNPTLIDNYNYNNMPVIESSLNQNLEI